MWSAVLIFIAVTSSNADQYQIKTTDLLTMADNRIIGGSDTTIEQYPFVVQIILSTWYRCGGILVTTSHVLSAARCFVDKNPEHNSIQPSRFFIRAATTIRRSGGSIHLVTAYKLHEQFNFRTGENNVAVVLMATPVDLTTSVARLALLPYQDTVVSDNSPVTVVGWGNTVANGTYISYSTVLMEVTLRKINLNTCQALQLLRSNKTVTSNMICTGILDVGGKGMCRGDVGGPLLYRGIVVGVASWWHNDCADPKFLDVYARVANYTNWINDMTGNRIKLGNIGSPSSKVGAITLLTPLLYLILSV